MAKSILCTNPDHYPDSVKAVAHLSWPDGRYRPSTACLDDLLWQFQDSYAEGHPVRVEPIIEQQAGTGQDLLGTVRLKPNGKVLAVLWPSPPSPNRWMVTDEWGSCGYETDEKVADWPVVGAVPFSPAAGCPLTSITADQGKQPIGETAPTLGQHIATLVEWLDASNPRTPHEISMRLLKVMEEAGEAASAYIGITGQNPRKGVTHSVADVQKELRDVAVTALVALASLTEPGQEHTVEQLLMDHLAYLRERVGAGETRD